MSDTSPIIRYKRKLMSSIVNSPELIKLIDPSFVDEDGDCVDVDDGLVYKQIFPYYYIPDTQSKALSYIIIKVNGLGNVKELYSKAEVYVCVMSHQDIMQVKGGKGTRIDMMGEIIEHLFNFRDDFGFGEMELKSDIEVNISDVHRGRELRFIVEDFNSSACPDD